jgi:hypothetical protein
MWGDVADTHIAERPPNDRNNDNDAAEKTRREGRSRDFK